MNPAAPHASSQRARVRSPARTAIHGTSPSRRGTSGFFASGPDRETASRYGCSRIARRAQIARGRDGVDERDVELAGAHERELDVAARVAQRDLEPDVALAQRAQCAGQHAGRERRAHEPDRDPSGPATRGRTRVAHECIRSTEQIARGREQAAAGFRQPDPPAFASEQLDAEQLFELVDLARQRRLRHVEPFGRTADVLGLGDGDEVVEQAQFDHRDLVGLDCGRMLS